MTPFVYIVRHEEGYRKLGFSKDPIARRKALESHTARFVFEIVGTPKDGEIQQPTEYRQGLWLNAAEAITIREARALANG